MDHESLAKSLAYGVISVVLCTSITIGGCHWAVCRAQEHEPESAVAVPTPAIPETALVISTSSLWNDDQSRTDAPLVSAELPAETQWAIFEQCGQDAKLFCSVMAIAAVESDFDSQTIGDGGNSIGMMQINTRWHTDRMESLGATDLTDPVQCAAVAIDYLLELEGIMDAGPGEHALYISYNCGPDSAKRKIRTGISSTAYSEAVMDFYRSYIAEIASDE